MHPNRMLSTYELQNFRRYIAVNPIGPGSRVDGAFDAMPPGLSRRSPKVKDFKRGGRYDFLARDEAPNADPEKLKAFLRDKLDPAFFDEICGDIDNLPNVKAAEDDGDDDLSMAIKDLLESSGVELHPDVMTALVRLCREGPPRDVQDDPAKPSTGAAMDSAGALKSFARLLPEAARIPVTSPSTPQRRKAEPYRYKNRGDAIAMDRRGSDSFSAMFPDAARIGRDPYPRG